MPTAIITTRGKTTIPKEIRSYLHLRTGDRVEFVINEKGVVLLIPYKIDVKELKGILPSPKKKISIEDMQKTIRKRAAKKCKV